MGTPPSGRLAGGSPSRVEGRFAPTRWERRPSGGSHPPSRAHRTGVRVVRSVGRGGTHARLRAHGPPSLCDTVKAPRPPADTPLTGHSRVAGKQEKRAKYARACGSPPSRKREARPFCDPHPPARKPRLEGIFTRRGGVRALRQTALRAIHRTAFFSERRRPVRSGPDRAGRAPPARTRGPATRRSTHERA